MSDSTELPEQHAIRFARTVAGHHWELPDNLQDALHINYNADHERVLAINEIVAAVRSYFSAPMKDSGAEMSREEIGAINRAHAALARLDEMEKKR